MVYAKFKLGVLYFLLNLATLSGDSILAGTEMRLFLGMVGAGASVPGNRRSGRKQCVLWVGGHEIGQVPAPRERVASRTGRGCLSKQRTFMEKGWRDQFQG